MRCGSDILAIEKIFLEACLKLSPAGANVVDIGLSRARLSLSQVEHAVASLSDGERIALTKIARLYARKTPYDKEDLIQETFARVLSLTLANSEQAYRPCGMRNMGSLSTIS